MIKLEDLTLYNDLRERLGQVTPGQIAAAERKIKDRERGHDKTKPGDVIGVIESEATRALYTLWLILEAETALERAKAQGADDAIVENDHMEKAAVVDMLGDVVKEMFWVQAKLDLGFHEFHCIAIRSGWRLIREHQRGHGPAGAIASLLLGGPPE